MSGSGLTAETQLRYLLQWFEEFSELQREDFLPLLSAAQSGKADQLVAALAQLSCQDKPVSLFQCRIKLFNEWYPLLTEDIKDRLVKGITEIDSDFGQKLQDAINNADQVNGDINGDEKENCTVNGDEHYDENPDSEIHQDNIPIEITAAS